MVPISIKSYSISRNTTHLPQIHFNIILPKFSFPTGFPTKTLYAFLDCSIRATCPAHLSRLDLRLLCINFKAASWRKRLGARLPPLGSRVRVSVPPCGFCGGRNGFWVGFSRGFSRFPLPQISFHHYSTLISSISFHFIRPCDGVSGVVGRHPCYSRTYNLGASSHLIPRPDLVLDTS